jgi:hypothetical protein
MFQLEESSTIVAIKENKSNPDIVCFQFELNAHIVNLKSYSIVAKMPARLFEWRFYNQYVLYDGTSLQLKTLEGETLLNFVLHVQAVTI